MINNYTSKHPPSLGEGHSQYYREVFKFPAKMVELVEQLRLILVRLGVVHLSVNPLHLVKTGNLFDPPWSRLSQLDQVSCDV